MRGTPFVLVVVSAVAACGHHRERELEPQHPCDLRGPNFPPRPDDLDEGLEREVSEMLAPDETALLESCTPKVDKPIDEPELKQLCSALASGHAAAGRDACRHACLAAGRAAVAKRLYVELVAELDTVARSGASACGTGASTTLEGDAAMRWWACFGHVALPARMKLEVRMHDTALEQVTITAPLFPNDAPYTFRYGKTDQGCGVEDFSVEVIPPRAW